MRFVSAYYLILLYLLITVKPIIPLAIDWYDHEFNEIEHISRVHLVYGNNHVDKEIINSNKESDPLKSGHSLSFHDDESSYTLPSFIQENFRIGEALNSFGEMQATTPCYVFLPQYGPPPECS